MKKKATDIAEEDRDYYLERKYPSFGNLCPRDIASRAAKEACDDERGVATSGLGVYLDFADAIARDGEDAIRARYGNLFQMYEKISGDDPYKSPMQIYPAVHYTMGGLWVDYNLMSNLPGLHVLGEANFSDHGANRLGASALMQGLADGYFVIPSTIAVYLSTSKTRSRHHRPPGIQDASKTRSTTASNRSWRLKGTVPSIPSTVNSDSSSGISAAWPATRKALEALEKIPKIRDEFWTNVRIPGSANGSTRNSKKQAALPTSSTFAEVLCHDALNREESCGGHFRSEHQFTEADEEVKDGTTQAGEAKRHDDQFLYVAAWEHTDPGEPPILHKEELVFEEVKPSIRSYK